MYLNEEDAKRALTRLHRRVTDYQQKAEHARIVRDALIEICLAQGMTAYKIAKATGLSQAAISRMKDKRGLR